MAFNANSYSTPKWWKEAVVYQIYPASFKDSNGDGWGDIQGITSKADYLKELGADVIWLSPIYKSPMADMGYDISDYKDIDPSYGTLSDVDELIAQLKARDMKLIMDLVVNHTSNEHAWFLESRSSKDNPKRDWYIWQPPKYDDQGNRRPPNNWGQLLGESKSAWTWDETTQEYYLSIFTPEQPDLNWENPVVRDAVHDVMRFWLDKGVSGFRMDVINLISKVAGFPEAAVVLPNDEYQPGDKFFANGPRLHEFLQEMNDKVLSKYDAMTVGEMPFVRDEQEILKVVNPDRNELNMIFNFEIVNIDDVPGGFRMATRDWKPSEIRRTLAKWQKTMIEGNGWNSVFLENHDNPRSVSRYVSDRNEGNERELGAKLLSLLITALGGTLFVYQGQEIGMRNVPPSWDVSEYKDVESINYWEKMQKVYEGKPEKLEEAKKLLQKKARDNSRTPMQWTPEKPNAGFCVPDVKPWMRACDEDAADGCNVESQKEIDHGLWQFWKLALKQRKDHKDTIVYGDFKLLGDDHDDDPVFAFQRWSKTESLVFICNFSGKEVQWTLPSTIKIEKWEGGNYVQDGGQTATERTLNLRPWEGLWGVNK